MHTDRSAPVRAPFLQTPESLIDDTSLSDGALRLLQALAKLPPRNGRNSDSVARGLRMGKDKTNAARKALRAAGHWHARKQQHPESGEIRDQRLASLTPLRTPDEIAAGWAAGEEAARLGKDTADSRRLGVRIVNSAPWYATPRPVTGPPATRTNRRRPLEGVETEVFQTPLTVPAAAPAPPPVGAPAAIPGSVDRSRERSADEPGVATPPTPRPELPGLPALTGPLAWYADQAEQVLLSLRRHDPPLPLTAADVHHLAQLAGHHLLRGDSRQTLYATLTHGLPPDGVRSPRGLLRDRLVRYLPPEGATPSEEPERAPAPCHESEPEPDGPVARIRAGEGIRAVLEAARHRP